MFKFMSKKGQNTVIKLSEYEETLIQEYYDDEEKPTSISEKTGIDLTLVNRFINTLAKRKERKQANNTNSEYNDLMQELKLEQKRHELQILREKNKLELEKKQLEIEFKRAELYGEDEEEDAEQEITPELQILKAFIDKIGQPKQDNNMGVSDGLQSVSSLSEATPQTQNLINNELDDKQINDIISQIPTKYIKLAKNMDDEALKVIIRNKYPLPENTINRAVEVIKSV